MKNYSELLAYIIGYLLMSNKSTIGQFLSTAGIICRNINGFKQMEKEYFPVMRGICSTEQ